MQSASVFTFDVIDGDEINEKTMDACAKLFSENYGVWGETAGPSLSGKRIRMSGSKLRKQSLSVPEHSVLSVCYGHDKLLGHAFATVWKYDGGSVGWVTQLVVDSTVRRRYIATQILQSLKRHKFFKDVTAVGLASSHPASVCALAKYSNVPVDQIDFDFMRKHAANILDSTPINYLKNVKPYGKLFDENCTTETVSSLFTQFYVDHTEPKDALNVFKTQGRWSLGDLPQGHEFLVIVPVVNP